MDARKTETLTLRLTADDLAALDAIVAKVAAEHAGEGARVTRASVVRGLIRKASKMRDAPKVIGFDTKRQ